MNSTKRGRRTRRVAVITGTRADYGLLRSTMEAIRKQDNLMLQVVVAGMHLLRKFGRTVDEIVRDGWHINARVKMQIGDDGPLDQAAGLSRGVLGIAQFLEQAGTDVVVVLGDRIEAMAGALAAVTTGRLVGHIHGGDIAPGDFDDSLRHAITKLAHVHLTATRAAGRRIIRMGESPDRVYWVGAPGLDRLMRLIRQTKDARKRTGRALILHHPIGRKPTTERRVMNAILKAVEEVGLTRTIVYPNSDRGHTGIVDAIEVYHRRSSNGPVQVVRSLDHDRYLGMLVDADVLVGNSSSGIVEAASAGTPVVNVGPRQQGRERHARYVVDAEESLGSIRGALQKALRKRPIIGGSTVYGDGRAGARIAQIIAKLPLDDLFRRKAGTLPPRWGKPT
ncbi:MAG: UDP-N-acetylglucosamine 2-epimerase (hydrolyzing) [Phycisphaerales bacterium]|nr:MAG: UDP-N-acetylglucosamine 2-epimerase (hydrolyzing) [Phycisphaerales bacterium]